MKDKLYQIGTNNDSTGDNCGIFAAYDLKENRNVAPYIVDGLISLQHRGQLSAGMMTFGESRARLLDTFKGNGLVNEVFNLTNPEEVAKIMDQKGGSAGIGHVRYATSGPTDEEVAQPYEFIHGRPWKWFGFAFNGNVANHADLRAELETEGYHIRSAVDTEILMHSLAHFNKGREPSTFSSIFANLQGKIDGAFNIAYLNGMGNLALYRDKNGFRPLSYGVTEDGIFMAASETNALRKFMRQTTDLKPGEMVTIDRSKREFKTEQVVEADPSHCYFEYVYFANVASELDGIPVYITRLRMGEQLADIEDQNLDDECVVISIPDSARAAGTAYASKLGIKQHEGIVHNRYVGRTFIESGDRTSKVKRKFSFIPEVIRGKRVFIVEDSLVRSTTLRTLIKVLTEECEPKEVHLRIANPPLMHPCFYGIDIPTRAELFAPGFIDEIKTGTLPKDVLQKMAEELGANSIKFLPLESIPKSIGMETRSLCMACINGDYPTPFGRKSIK